MKIKLNKIIKYLIYSDLVFYTGWGLISPIFAIFILQNILGGTAFVVGLAAAVNLIVRSAVRVPFGVYADRSQKIAYHLMLWGLLATALVPIGYIYSTLPWHIYLLQAVYGVVISMSTAGWTSIFSKHMDHGKESTEWGIDAVAVGIGPGIAAALGGAAVTLFSFNIVFVVVAIIGLIGVLLLLAIKKDVIEYKLKQEKITLHRALANRIRRNHNYH